MYYSDFCKADVNFLFLFFAMVWKFKVYKQLEKMRRYMMKKRPLEWHHDGSLIP